MRMGLTPFDPSHPSITGPQVSLFRLMARLESLTYGFRQAAGSVPILPLRGDFATRSIVSSVQHPAEAAILLSRPFDSGAV